jgi:NTP pyrophosphatase (non-canonical NTP hydrolase)
MPPSPLIDYAQAIDDLSEEINSVNESKGFGDNPYLNDFGIIITKTDLIANEVAEMIDVFRNRYDDDTESAITFMTPLQEEDFTEELADVVIRALDLAGHLELALGNSILAKIQKNRERPYRHGKRF